MPVSSIFCWLVLTISVLFYDRNHFPKPIISAEIGKTVSLNVTSYKGAGNLQFSFVKKRSDRYIFPTSNASVLNILLDCTSRISIISWQKSLSLAFHSCCIMQKTVFLHVTPCKGAGNLQFSFVKKRSDRYLYLSND